jgi:glycerol-3-phosphate acyltransferase PlsY
MFLMITLFILLTYLIGSIPFGLLLAKIFASTDIRNFGSKNIGATNVNRILGRKLGFATFALDASKGILPIIFVKYFLNLDTDLEFNKTIEIIFATVAVLGHMFSIYLKFRGGKGVATFLACTLVLQPFLGFFGLFIWVCCYFIFKISSIAGIVACLSIGLFAGFFGFNLGQHLLWLILSILIVVKHWQNILRLIKKTEK